MHPRPHLATCIPLWQSCVFAIHHDRWRSWESAQPRRQGGPQGQITRDTLKLVTRLLLRQQEAISTLRLSTGCVWWLRIPQPTPIPALVQAAQTWREEVVKEGQSLQGHPDPTGHLLGPDSGGLGLSEMEPGAEMPDRGRETQSPAADRAAGADN